MEVKYVGGLKYSPLTETWVMLTVGKSYKVVGIDDKNNNNFVLDGILGSFPSKNFRIENRDQVIAGYSVPEKGMKLSEYFTYSSEDKLVLQKSVTPPIEYVKMIGINIYEFVIDSQTFTYLRIR